MTSLSCQSKYQAGSGRDSLIFGKDHVHALWHCGSEALLPAKRIERGRRICFLSEFSL